MIGEHAVTIAMRICIGLLCTVVLCAQSIRAATIEMVTVGNPGNAADLRYNVNVKPEGFGAVSYIYQVGKYEITAGQYTEFLNAVAKSDPNQLYYPPSAKTTHIEQSGSSPNFSYSVAADWANRPVGNVNFWDAARFCNWLHNGQPIGPQGPGTTEDGAYHNIGNQNLFGRNSSAKFFIPNEDEWYKAAYHDASAGLAGRYFDYPTRTNTAPGMDATESTNTGNNANYTDASYWLFSPYYRTDVGEFELSQSPYGTFDQGGNVVEWIETWKSINERGLRGGGYGTDVEILQASSLYGTVVFAHFANVGFRIAASAPTPEPSFLAGFALATAMLSVYRVGNRRPVLS